MLAKPLYNADRGIEYTPLVCFNDDGIADRIKSPGANPCIFAVNATQKLNSDIAIEFRRTLDEKRIDFLIPFERALEEVLENNTEYTSAPDAPTQSFYEAPFLETQALIDETTGLVAEKKEASGILTIKEQGKNTKDRYSSISYGNWLATLLEKDLMQTSSDYEFVVFIN